MNQHLGFKSLILDLDETLVHSSFDKVDNPDYIVKILSEDGEPLNIYVLIRPYLKEFLEAISPHFEIVIFTASMSDVRINLYIYLVC